MASTPQTVHFPSAVHQIAAHLYRPLSSAPNRNTAAIVIGHPMTGVKEQTSATYATYLSNAGFIALTFDAAYQGESTGEPRGLEDPHQRVEDVKSAVTYLSSLPEVDSTKIGVVGICASGGYTSYATASDSRIRALATVSGACVGRMTRCGGVHEHLSENAEAISGALMVAAEWRKNEAQGGQGAEVPRMFDAQNVPDDADPFFRGAAQYYGTERGRHERSTQRVPPSSYDLMVAYDSFNFQHLIAPRPLLMIAGSEAETLHYSREAVRLAREPKELFVVPGKNHFDLYDELEESGPKLVEFFSKYLA
ncbi:hydrolase of the alpha/beta superfamily [Aspergillus sclerotiicarbonarius CBS 121057]|uniref:Hydrolase of the alpha/beta superfamily n=1 Tax=Aspergillus sclerotiicarbonarius (strain CBS 121057 / IBT 28362) TaxID=1448318 RepID=A0A319EEK9_ASPSB|nr:hydrolase of the alpha/beta superfamily [Aspergillus sclerotiicarbonarius CBS 121057]